MRNIVHTVSGVYEVSDPVYEAQQGEEDYQLTDDGISENLLPSYLASSHGQIQSVNAFDEYFFTAYGSSIYYCSDK